MSCSVALVVSLLASSARGELAAWDRARVTEVAKELVKATDALEEAFLRQPPPDPGSIQRVPYLRLKNRVRMLRSEARVLLKSLEEGDGREHTDWIYTILISHARSARYEAAKVFVAEEVGEKARVVRGLLNQLGPYYDQDFTTLAPAPSIEPGPAR